MILLFILIMTIARHNHWSEAIFQQAKFLNCQQRFNYLLMIVLLNLKSRSFSSIYKAFLAFALPKVSMADRYSTFCQGIWKDYQQMVTISFWRWPHSYSLTLFTTHNIDKSNVSLLSGDTPRSPLQRVAPKATVFIRISYTPQRFYRRRAGLLTI